MSRNLADYEIYLSRMTSSLQEKLKIIKFIPTQTKALLDVGCADGAVTIEMAKLFPEIEFLGIDLNKDFISLARENSKNISNVSFENIYLRDLLAKNTKYDVVTFCSVLHEFYTYGEGISSVVKAISDAHELLKKEGVVIIRDMILSNYTINSSFHTKAVVEKIVNTNYSKELEDFEKHFGKVNSLYKLNHFLLKYWYTENWDREVKENYVPVNFEEYEKMFELLGMNLLYKESYLIPYLKNKWINDFKLIDEETWPLKSTGFLVSQK